jgi:hypothetical protein
MLEFETIFSTCIDRRKFTELIRSNRKAFVEGFDLYGPVNYRTQKYKYLSELAYLLFSEKYREGVDVVADLRKMYTVANRFLDNEDTVEYIKLIIHSASVHMNYDLSDLEPKKTVYYYRLGRVERIVRESFTLHR